MKSPRKKRALTLGELMASVCDVCGCRKAAGILRLAADAHLIEFHGLQHLVISPRIPEKLFPRL
jgi:hypothetical protein